jgi:hypothetical protein
MISPGILIIIDINYIIGVVIVVNNKIIVTNGIIVPTITTSIKIIRC